MDLRWAAFQVMIVATSSKQLAAALPIAGFHPFNPHHTHTAARRTHGWENLTVRAASFFPSSMPSAEGAIAFCRCTASTVGS